MTVRWNARPVLDRVRQGTVTAAEKAAHMVVAEAERLMYGPHTGRVYTTDFITIGSGPGRRVVPAGQREAHQASAPGEAPAVDTGRLVGSSQVEAFPAQYRAVARWTDPAAAFMQFGTDRVQPRPFATLALYNVAPMMPDIFATEIRAIFR